MASIQYGLALLVPAIGRKIDTSMNAVNRVRDHLLDNVGHQTYPGNASFDLNSQRWFVPIYCRTMRGAIVVGEVELDTQGRILLAPSREELLTRMAAMVGSASAVIRSNASGV